jgi:hypothetical protein
MEEQNERPVRALGGKSRSVLAVDRAVGKSFLEVCDTGVGHFGLFEKQGLETLQHVGRLITTLLHRVLSRLASRRAGARCYEKRQLNSRTRISHQS